MKINFSEELFSQLIRDASSTGTSVPALVNKILNNYYKLQNSHKKVTHETEYFEKGRPL